MTTRFARTDQARRLFEDAAAHARRLGHPSASAAHILMSIWNVPPSLAGHVFDEFEIDLHELSQRLEAALREEQARELPAESLEAIQEKATYMAEAVHSPFVDNLHVLVAALQSCGSPVRRAFERLGVPLQAVLARAQVIAVDLALGKAPPKLSPTTKRKIHRQEAAKLSRFLERHASGADPLDVRVFCEQLARYYNKVLRDDATVAEIKDRADHPGFGSAAPTCPIPKGLHCIAQGREAHPGSAMRRQIVLRRRRCIPGPTCDVAQAPVSNPFRVLACRR